MIMQYSVSKNKDGNNEKTNKLNNEKINSTNKHYYGENAHTRKKGVTKRWVEQNRYLKQSTVCLQRNIDKVPLRGKERNNRARHSTIETTSVSSWAMNAVSASCAGCRIRCCAAIHGRSSFHGRNSCRWRSWPGAEWGCQCGRWKPRCGRSAPGSSGRRKPHPWPYCGSGAGAAGASSMGPGWSAGVSPPAGHL